MGTGERDAASDASAASPPEPGGGGAGLRAAGRVAALGLLFAVLTLGVTYPMVEDPTELLGRRGPAEGPHFVGDARAALGYVQRGADAFEQRGSIWPIVFSNPDVHVPPAYLFVAGALAHGTGSAVGAHNAVLWGSVFLAFVCMYGLVRHLTGDDVAALYAAVFFGGANYVVHHLIAGHANQVQVFWFPLAFWVTELALERPGWARGAILGGVIGLTALWVVHYAVFLAVLLPVYVVFRAPGRLVDRRFLVGLVMMGVVALCLCGPYLVGSMEAGPVERTLRVNQRYSLRALENLLIPDAYQHIGVLPILLALAGLLVPARVAAPSLRRGFAAVAVASLGLALGPMSAWHPYTWLYEGMPFFDLMRTPVRFVAPALMAILVLAGFALHALRTMRAGRSRLGWGLLVAVFAGSVWATPGLDAHYYERGPVDGRIWFVDRDPGPRPADRAVLELPSE